MPKIRINKTQEEKSSEEFFPMDQSLKRTIEKKIKDPPKEKKTIAITTIEKEYKKPQQNKEESTTTKKKRFSKKPFTKKPFKKISRAKIKKTQFVPQKISLKKDSFELIITEKPQAAAKIADALGIVKQTTNKGVSYYEVDRNNKKIVVVCAVGHLFTLHQKNPGSQVPIFDISWVPNFLVRKNAEFTKKYFDTISTFAKKAQEITVATDYDVEGEVIGLNIVRYLCGQSDANRMKFSTLTAPELNKAYETKSKVLNWGQAIAGETRHYLDWFYGINLSRALMNAIKTTGRFKIMSIGRVQGPALNLIVEKEKEIMAFKPIPYSQVFITVKNGHIIELKHNKDIFEKTELKKFENFIGKETTANTTKTEQKLEPGVPFNLTTLQTEAYKFFGITPARTLQIAQSLYLAGLISYPRTSSQKLPSAIPYKEIKDNLARKLKVSHLMKNETPLEGKKTDPAHPSIYPTGNFQILSGEDEKIYNLIVQRFLSLFCEDAIIDKKKISVEIDNLLFTTDGSQVRKKAWMEIYPSKLKENEIPDLNGKVKIINVKIEDKLTQPPRRYSPASIISELEKRNLGTKATRSSILDTLYDRGYIKETSIEATPLGISLIETLDKYSPEIIDEKLTRSFENSMESIVEATKGYEEKENKIIEKAKKTINEIAKEFEKNEKLIGSELVNASDEMREQQKEQNTLNPCPVCQTGNLIINYSKKTRRFFVACNSYPNCKNTYSLPPNGIIKRTEKNCVECNWPILMRISKGKRPWEFCFNPNCKINKERIEEYNRKKQEENQSP